MANITLDASDVLRLIQAHLAENGLHEACRVLRDESGVGAAGVINKGAYYDYASSGQWGKILEGLGSIDKRKCPAATDLLADVHEMAVLELADIGEIEMAYATLRLVESSLDRSSQSSKVTNRSLEESIPRSRIIEQRLAALVALRNPRDGNSGETPPDYYGRGKSRKKRREQIGKNLMDTLPTVPSSRLLTLLQQAIKWQSHTGELPMIRQHFQDEDDENIDDEGKDSIGIGSDKHRKKKKRKRRKEFDLVLGEVNAKTTVVGDGITSRDDDKLQSEVIIENPYSTIKFGKKAVAECALFTQDGSSLISGSSDGLIEIWSADHKYAKLRLDLPYQEKEELLWHDDPILSLALSNDGELLASGDSRGLVKVWRIESGKCLREINAHERAAVSAITFSFDSSHILTGSHDHTCREFGLRTSRMLKEFRGHTSYVNSCAYVLHELQQGTSAAVLRVVSGSHDGTVRIWDGKTSECYQVLQPTPSAKLGSSILVDHNNQGSVSSNTAGVESHDRNIHTVVQLHTPPGTMIVIPRGRKAFLISLGGSVLRVYESDDKGSGKTDFVTGTVSPSNRWLYAVTEDGNCYVFDITTGKGEQCLTSFADDSTTSSKSDEDGIRKCVEMTGVVHHPHKGVLAAYSNDKGQKRGLITIWR